MKIGCCVSLKELRELGELQNRKKELPFSFVDLSGQELAAMEKGRVYELADTLKKWGISCEGIHGTFPPALRLTGEDRDERRLRAYFLELAARCRILNCSRVGIGSPLSRNLPPDYPGEKADCQMVGNLRMFADLAGDMSILLESIHTGETNYINRLEHAYRLVVEADREQVGLVGDIYHFRMCGEDLERIPAPVWERIRYLHIADPKGRRFPSPACTPEFKQYARMAMKKAVCADMVVVEAVTDQICRDAAISVGILRNWGEGK